jgi:hypothetical protein
MKEPKNLQFDLILLRDHDDEIWFHKLRACSLADSARQQSSPTMNKLRRTMFIVATFVLAACFGITVLHSQPLREGGSSVLGVFVGSTPCDELPRQFLGIPTNSPCERITWQLTLLTQQNTRLPATYKLVSTYGIQAQSAPGFVEGGTTVEVQGTWAIVKGTKSSPDAVVYALNADKPQRSMSFVKVGDQLLHLLNRDKGLMIGNASWSYTLNKKGMNN